MLGDSQMSKRAATDDIEQAAAAPSSQVVKRSCLWVLF
jgi:hypothetical protein